MGLYLGPKNRGSLSLAAIISVTALTLGFFYVAQTSKQTRQAVDVALETKARELGQSSNLSNLAILRSLLSQSKTPDQLAYQPPLFADNYFADTWTFVKNTKFSLPYVESKDRKITVRSFSPGSSSMDAITPILTGKASPLTAFKDTETLEVVRQNQDPKNPYYISSVDVKATRLVAVDSAKTRDKNVVTFGRIALPAPIPQGITVKIKNVNDTDFGANFGSNDAPLPPGKYILQLSGRGVIHHGEIIVNGETIKLGLDNEGRIIHGANNVRADAVIGQTRVFDLSGSPADDQAHVVKDGCAFDVKNEMQPGILPGALNVTAELFSVDGTVPPGMARHLTVVVGKPAPLADNRIANACQSSCPVEGYKKVYGNDEKFSRALDRALTPGAAGNDVFEAEKSLEVNSKKGRGIVCSNYELTAAQIKENTGMTATQLLGRGYSYYRKAIDDTISLKQYVSFMAPSCKREIVGLRNGCGCFAADTLIQMADGSHKPASEIRAGDMIWNPKKQKAQEIKKVIAGPERWPLLSVVSGGRSVLVTGEHPFLTKDGLKPAYRLTDKDVLIDGDQENSIVSIKMQERKEGEAAPEVWNFELVGSTEPDDHYVVANGIMTGDLYLQIKINGRDASRPVVSE